jgi:hypothetical protein
MSLWPFISLEGFAGYKAFLPGRLTANQLIRYLEYIRVPARRAAAQQRLAIVRQRMHGLRQAA